MVYSFTYAQNLEQHKIRGLFLYLLEKNKLQAGSNYLIDKNDNIWVCETWASGGIWYIQKYSKIYDLPEVYTKVRRSALLNKDTIFEKGE